MRDEPQTDRIKFSGEFASRPMEIDFLEFKWHHIKRVTCRTLLVVAFMGLGFFVSDLITIRTHSSLALLLTIRLATVGAIAAVAFHIGRSTGYAKRFEYLLFAIQLLIPAAILAIAVVRNLPAVYIGIDTIIFTLIYYQFLNSNFRLTVLACVLFGLSAIALCALLLDFKPVEIVGGFLFLVPLNYLGVVTLRSINRTRRKEYVAFRISKQHNLEKERLIKELQGALAEVKTLQGFLPICARCKNIRNDKGYWERIEKYIQDRTDAKFSHSLCPNCTQELYRDLVKDSSADTR